MICLPCNQCCTCITTLIEQHMSMGKGLFYHVNYIWINQKMSESDNFQTSHKSIQYEHIFTQQAFKSHIKVDVHISMLRGAFNMSIQKYPVIEIAIIKKPTITTIRKKDCLYFDRVIENVCSTYQPATESDAKCENHCKHRFRHNTRDDGFNSYCGQIYNAPRYTQITWCSKIMYTKIN